MDQAVHEQRGDRRRQHAEADDRPHGHRGHAVKARWAGGAREGQPHHGGREADRGRLLQHRPSMPMRFAAMPWTA